MSEQPIEGSESAREADQAGATDEEFGNLSVEDSAEGTTDPADLTEDEPPPAE